jgi:hypothetical protein
MSRFLGDSLFLPITFFGIEQRLSLPFFANPSQVLRKFAKKPKGGLREVAKKLRRNPTLFSLSRAGSVLGLFVSYFFITPVPQAISRQKRQKGT